MTTTWTDLSQTIRDRLDACLPLYKRAVAFMADPAVSVVAICPDTVSVFLKSAGELSEESKKALEFFHHVHRDLTFDDMVFLKTSVQLSSLTSPVAQTMQTAQRMIGGPNALTNSLVGGALTGLGGYALGSAYDNLVPRTLKRLLPHGPNDEETIGETHMARNLGLLGAGAGASFGALRGATNMLNGHSLGESWLGQHPWHNAPTDIPGAVNPLFEKAASETGALFVPTIPVDAFNRAIWTNVGPQNPFGTRDAWGDNSQPMHTPPQVAASIGGLISAAGAAKGSGFVSPWDVAQVVTHAGINSGIGGLAGAATGLMAGKMLGALAGLSPAAQQQIQRTGLWAGVMTGLAKSIF